MSIGLYNPYLDTMSGGEKYMLTLARCLAKNHSVTLFWDPQQKEDIIKKATERFGFNLRGLHFSDDLFVKHTSLQDRYIKSRKYDRLIVLSDGSIPTVFSPLILHFQTPVEWVQGKSLKNRVKMSRVKRVICNSKFTKSFIDATFGISSDLLYPPVSLPTLKGFSKEQIILHVGRFGIQQGGSSYKKQEVMAKAFMEMVDKGFSGWKLVFVMSVKDSDLSKVEEFRESVSGYPVDVIINPSNDTLWETYEKASLYWHASGFGEDLKKNPDRAEHFGISTVEAMGMGAVPLTYKAGGQIEIIEDGENGYLWTTPEGLKDLTLDLAKDTVKRKKMGDLARQRAAEFSENRFCEKARRLIL